jgi:hypothetical protein
MKKQWTVFLNGEKIESVNGSLPKQIDKIRSFVNEREGFVPIEPFLSSIPYDETKTETVLAAAYAYASHMMEVKPYYKAKNVEIPYNDEPAVEGEVN